jgi:hypothetical protein
LVNTHLPADTVNFVHSASSEALAEGRIPAWGSGLHCAVPIMDVGAIVGHLPAAISRTSSAEK